MSACRTQRRRLERAFEGSLSIEERFALEQHAAECPRCGADLAAQTQLAEGLEDLPVPPAERLDLDAAVTAVGRRIDAAAPPVHAFRMRRVAALAALVVGVVAAGLLLARGRAAGDAISEDGIVAPREAEDTHDGDPMRDMDSHVARGAAQLMPPPPLETGLEWEALADARAEIEFELRTALGDADPEGDTGWTTAFEDAAAELARSWPVETHLVRLLKEGDEPLRGAAARVLGRGCGSLARAQLVKAVDDPSVGRAATLALIDLGPEGLGGLQRAFWITDLRPLVVAAYAQLDADLRVEQTGGLIRRGARDRKALAAATPVILELLEGSGKAGSQALFDLASNPRFERDVVLASLARTPQAVEVLLATIDDRGDEALLLEAARYVQDPDLLDWVVGRSRRSRMRSQAAAALASYPGPDALEALLALEERRGVASEVFLSTWQRALDHGPEGPDELAIRLLSAGLRDRAKQLAELLVVAARTECAPALARLAGAPLLDEEPRREAALAVGVLGDATHTSALFRAFEGLGRRESSLGAALCVSVHALGGAPLLSTLLDGLPTRAREGVLKVFLEDAPERVRLYRIARELEPVLNDRITRVSEKTL